MAVGHPKDISKDRFQPESLESILTWANSEREMKLYLDFKYPTRWRTSVESVLRRLLSFDRQRLVLISYDLHFFAVLAEQLGFATGVIVDEPPDFWPGGLLLIPLSQVSCLHAEQKQTRDIIVTQVNTRTNFHVVRNLSYSRIMTDKPTELLNYGVASESNRHR